MRDRRGNSMSNNLVQKTVLLCGLFGLAPVSAYNHLNIYNQLPDDEVTVVVTHKRGRFKSDEELARLSIPPRNKKSQDKEPQNKQVIPLKDDVLSVRVDVYYPAIIRYRGSEIEIGNEKKSYEETFSFEADKPGQTKSLIISERTLKLDQGKQGQGQEPVVSTKSDKAEIKKVDAEVVGAGAGAATSYVAASSLAVGAGARRSAGPIVKSTSRIPQTQEQAAKAPESARIPRIKDMAKPQVDATRAEEVVAARKALNEKRERDAEIARRAAAAERDRQLADWSTRAEMFG